MRKIISIFSNQSYEYKYGMDRLIQLYDKCIRRIDNLKNQGIQGQTSWRQRYQVLHFSPLQHLCLNTVFYHAPESYSTELTCESCRILHKGGVENKSLR